MDRVTLVLVVLVALCVGGLFYALIYPYVSGQARAERRQKQIVRNDPKVHGRSREMQSRRNQVADSLRELEARQKRARTPPLSVRLEQAGLSISKSRFYVLSVIAALVCAFLALTVAHSTIAMVAALFVGGLLLPRWVVRFLIKRRRERFLNEFPNAIDVIVRGVRAGLPLGDSMRVVASDAQEPVRSEFREILATQSLGLPLAESVARLQERMPLPEANFFSIVVAIQSQSGGSLSDALSNLSKVLRDRRKMKGKIKAMSQEAKSSAAIIGSLPIVVGFLVYLTSPGYISVLWTTRMGYVLLAVSAFWMTCGILVMRRMINFEI